MDDQVVGTTSWPERRVSATLDEAMAALRTSGMHRDDPEANAIQVAWEGNPDGR